jgi:hypothetical protein
MIPLPGDDKPPKVIISTFTSPAPAGRWSFGKFRLYPFAVYIDFQVVNLAALPVVSEL